MHAHAVRWISRMESREHVEYRPRDHEGEVRSINASWANPETVVADVEQYLERGMNVMFLTSCSYMLQPLIRTLREAGVPFHNPYRRRNGAWNPLQRRRGQTTTSDRVLSFLNMSQGGMWNAEDLNRWTDMVRVKGVLNTNGRKLIKTLTDTYDGTKEGGYVNWDDLYSVLTEEAIEAGLMGNLDWFEENLTSAKSAAAKFPMAIARRRGVESLTQPPRVSVGTIHSVKGAESDVVYVFPDISRAGMREWSGSAAQQASVYRLFYVAMTRARDTLVLARQSEDHFAVDLGR